MLKLIGVVAVTWFLFATGIAQLMLIWTMVVGNAIFGV